MKGKWVREVESFSPLCEEYVLREAFGQESVRKQFICDITGIQLTDVKSVTLAPNYLRKAKKRIKQGILDFVMTMDDEVRIDVELQLRPQKFWVKRNLFYLSRLYVDELFVGENYEKLKKCITISILDFNLLEDRHDNHSVFTLKDERGRELTDLFEIHVVELKKSLSGNEAIDRWVRLFQAKSHEDLNELENQEGEGFRRAVETVKTMSLGWYFQQLQKAKRDRWAEDEYVRDEGRAEGRIEGRAESIIEILEAKGAVPEAYKEKIRLMTNQDILKKWNLLAASVDTVEEFIQGVK